LDVALLFYRYALVTHGRQQLLSYTTVVEALVGEKGLGITTRLKNRVAFVLGTSKRRFNRIYDLRCMIVHGDEKMLDESVLIENLCEARNFARRLLVWFVHYLGYVLDKCSADPGNNRLPTREELLSVLDPAGDRRGVPSDFPETPGWCD
jgi:hypothetical protein